MVPAFAWSWLRLLGWLDACPVSESVTIAEVGRVAPSRLKRTRIESSSLQRSGCSVRVDSAWPEPERQGQSRYTCVDKRLRALLPSRKASDVHRPQRRQTLGAQPCSVPPPRNGAAPGGPSMVLRCAHSGWLRPAGDSDLGRVLSSNNPKLKKALEVWWRRYYPDEPLTFAQIRQRVLEGPNPQRRSVPPDYRGSRDQQAMKGTGCQSWAPPQSNSS